MSNTNTNADSIAKQLAERRARLQQTHPSNHPPTNAVHTDDFEFAQQLQRQFDAENTNHSPDDNACAPPELIDSDIEMLDDLDAQPTHHPQQQSDHSTVVDADYEIALQLQRQFDNEDSNVPSPNTANPNRTHLHHQSMNQNHRQMPSGQPSYNTSTTNRTHNGGGTTIITSQMGPNGNVIRTVHTNTNSNHNNAFHPMSQNPFNHPFFQQQQSMPGMSGFNHPFFTQQHHNHDQNHNNNNHNHNNDPFNDPFFSVSPMLNMNMMVNNLMMGGGPDGMSFAFMQPRPQVANQQNVDALPTDTYRAKSKTNADHNVADEALDEEEKQMADQECTENKKETCSICLEEFKDGEEIRRLPCFHIFHKKEIDRWLLTGADKCPICRVPINGRMRNQ